MHASTERAQDEEEVVVAVRVIDRIRLKLKRSSSKWMMAFLGWDRRFGIRVRTLRRTSSKLWPTTLTSTLARNKDSE